MSEVDRSELLDRLELDHELATDKQVESRLAYVPTLLVDPDDNVACECHIAEPELRRERLFVHGFQEAWTKMPRNLERCVEHCPCQSVDARIWFPKIGDLGVVAVHSPPVGLACVFGC